MTRLVALATLVGGSIGGASAMLALGDTDMYWHLANATEMFARGLARTDLYSWTVRGAAVPTDQWLGDALLGLGYLLAGWTGVLAVRSVAVAVLVGAIALAAFIRRPQRPVVALAVALPAIVLSRYLWVERPELFGAACLAVLVVLFQIRRERATIALAPLLVLWANLHGSFALGSGLVLLYSAYGLWHDRAQRRGYLIAAAGALVALVATPSGSGTLATPSTHLLSPPREIQEWAPPDLGSPPGMLWAIVLMLTLGTAAVRGGASARDLILIVPTAMLSLVAIRHTPFFAIAATPYLAQHLPVAITSVGRAFRPADAAEPTRRERMLKGAGRASVGLGLAILAIGIAIGPREPDETAYPRAALAYLGPGPGLYADYDWGGWLIWRAPASPVFVDGRLGLYRDPILADYVTILEARPGWRDVLERHGVRTLLVRPGDPVAVRAQELGWPVVTRSSSFLLISVGHR